MSEWVFEAAGAGGTASPAQYWDIESRSVRVGPERIEIKPDDVDFELLRPAVDSAGSPFPGRFSWSPDDGSALIRPREYIKVRAGPDGLPEFDCRSTDVFVADPKRIHVPGGKAVLAGNPSIGLICDFERGSVYRWSERLEGWRAIAPLPVPAGFAPCGVSACTPVGFAFAGAGRAAAVLWPGPKTWQHVELSPAEFEILSPAIGLGEDAVLLARAGANLALLRWSAAGHWQTDPITVEGLQEMSKPVYLRPAAAGLIGANGGRAFQITADLRFLLRDWPDGFSLAADSLVFWGETGIWGLGRSGGVAGWAAAASGRNAPKFYPCEEPVTPFRGGFIASDGLSKTPLEGAAGGYRLPRNCVGRPLALFADALLMLSVEAGSLWAEALGGTRRRWRVRLVLAAKDSAVRDVGAEWRLDRLDEVAALPMPQGVAILGTSVDEALVWKKTCTPDPTN